MSTKSPHHFLMILSVALFTACSSTPTLPVVQEKTVNETTEMQPQALSWFEFRAVTSSSSKAGSEVIRENQRGCERQI